MTTKEVDTSACSIGLLFAQTENRTYGPNTITALVSKNSDWFATSQENLRRMGCNAIYGVFEGKLVMSCEPANCHFSAATELDPKA